MSSTPSRKRSESGKFHRPKYVNKPFARLPLKQRACAILTLSGFTYKELLKLGFGYRTIRKGVAKLSDEKYR